ncbi:unnamed protein product [Haemonchus placei]|uniref:Uncharacterized protein n=1 Tax=Haemonchus placei TaxID=6290 RepID=A0A0N4W6U6_HAEPC|nr:unnamed protein product [Haemonchus placei]
MDSKECLLYVCCNHKLPATRYPFRIYQRVYSGYYSSG